MVRRWIEWLRNRRADGDKALDLVAEASRQEFRHALASYDAFVDPAKAISEGLLLGTAVSSGGERIPLRLPFGSEYVHWIVQGGTGTGKTTWIASILEQEMAARRPFGIIDCKGDLFEATLTWTAALADRLAPEQRARLLDDLVLGVNYM